MRVERSARSIVQKAVITRAKSYRIGVAEMVAVISLCLVIRVEAEITSVWCTCSKQSAGGLFSGGGVCGSQLVCRFEIPIRTRLRFELDKVFNQDSEKEIKYRCQVNELP